MAKKQLPILLLVLFVFVGLREHAYAYIDAGTGSYLLQLVLAGMFGMIISAKSLWAKVRSSLKSSRNDDHS